MNKTMIEGLFKANKERFFEQWREFLRFKSVSADPAYNADCRHCAKWLVRRLQESGFGNARLIETPSLPVVFAERQGKPGSPVVLFYGHYDVQPADPLGEWRSPPFEPELRDGRLYARGAQDNKGQLLYALDAMETLAFNNGLNCTVKILIEGEEESGSRGLEAVMPGLCDTVRGDILMACDTGMASSGAPAITMGLRGLLHLSIRLTGPVHDLHSGTHGGRAPNPATEIARLVASLHDEEGRVAVAGFYENVNEPSAEERALVRQNLFDVTRYEKAAGVPPAAGEKRFSPMERVGFRPSLDVNGIHSGYDGPGSKTIIPAVAVAKITARLVKGQDPDKCLARIIEHLHGHGPCGLKLEITEKGAVGKALSLDINSTVAARAARVLREIADQEPVFVWEGASIPILSALSVMSGAEPLLVGFGSEEDSVHAPNESFSLSRFKMGYLYVAGLLSDIK